ncbi:MAG: hypothetical protein WC365_03790, partial [Candidatus Babeliales bacterium]
LTATKQVVTQVAHKAVSWCKVGFDHLTGSIRTSFVWCISGIGSALNASATILKASTLSLVHGFVATGNVTYRNSLKIAHTSVRFFAIVSHAVTRVSTYIWHAFINTGIALKSVVITIARALSNFIIAFFTTLRNVLTAIGKALVSPAAIYAILTASFIGTGWYGYRAGWFLFDTIPQEQKKLKEFSQQLEIRLTTTEQELATLQQTFADQQHALEQTTQHEAQQLQEVKQSTVLAKQELQDVKTTLQQTTKQLDNKIEEQGKALAEQVATQNSETIQNIALHKTEIAHHVAAHEQKVARTLTAYKQNLTTKIEQGTQSLTKQLDEHQKAASAYQKETAQKINSVNEKLNFVDAKAAKAITDTQVLEKKIDHVQQLHDTKIAVNKTIRDEVENQVGALREEIKIRQKEKKRKEVLSKLIDQIVTEEE